MGKNAAANEVKRRGVLKKHRGVFLLFLLFISAFASAQVIDRPKSPLDAFCGNWFSDQSGWVLGVYDSVVIANNRIYTCEQVHKRKKEVELALRDRQGGQATTIRLKAGKNGTCRLMQDGKRRELMRSARQVEVICDNGYRTFFHADTATLQGIIDGYNPRLGFNTGMIYLRDIVTGEDNPTVVPIAPDGTVTIRLPLQHPMSLFVLINKKRFFFFLEPGQVQTMYLDCNSILAQADTDGDTSLQFPTQYMGDNAHLSYLTETLSKSLDYDFLKFTRGIQTQTPTQFKECLRQDADRWRQKGDSLEKIYGASRKAMKLIRQAAFMKEGYLMFYFLRYRPLYAQRSPDNEVLKVPVTEDFHDFLRHMPLDDPEVLASDYAFHFLGSFAFMPILREDSADMYADSTRAEEEHARHWLEYQWAQRAREDSIVAGLCGTDRPFLWQAAEIQRTTSCLTEQETYETLQTYKVRQKERLKEHPYLAAAADKIYTDLQAELCKKKLTSCLRGRGPTFSAASSESTRGRSFLLIFGPHGAGGCLFSIKFTADLRRKYKDHPDFRFIYITGEEDSPRSVYDKFVDEHLRGEACYYLSGKEFNYLRQLFQFNAVPHYEVVEKDGTISRVRPDSNSLRDYLNDRFPLEE